MSERTSDATGVNVEFREPIRTCSQCGAQNGFEALTCAECGTTLPWQEALDVGRPATPGDLGVADGEPRRAEPDTEE